MAWGLGFGVPSLVLKISNLGLRVYGLRFRVWGLEFRAWESSRVQGFEFRLWKLQGSGVEVPGPGSRIKRGG